MYGTESMRLEILRYYINGNPYNPEHDRYAIRELKSLNYLSSGITVKGEEYLRTTEMGRLYISNNPLREERPILSRIKRLFGIERFYKLITITFHARNDMSQVR